MSNFCVFTVSEFLSHLPRNSRASGDGNSDFLSFFVFRGRKLLWACLKAPALTGYVGDAYTDSCQKWSLRASRNVMMRIHFGCQSWALWVIPRTVQSVSMHSNWAGLGAQEGPLFGENQKDGGKGTGKEKKRHDDLRQTSRQFTTFYDNVRHFMTVSVSLSLSLPLR